MVIDEVTATVLGGCGLLLGGSLLIWFSIVGVEKTVRSDRPRVRPGAAGEQSSAPRSGVFAEGLGGARSTTAAARVSAAARVPVDRVPVDRVPVDRVTVDRVTVDGGPADRARGGYGVAAILRRCDGGSARASRDSSHPAARHAADRAVRAVSSVRSASPAPRGRAVDVPRVVRPR